MNILFLSQEISSSDNRDIVTYTFIIKEMNALVKRGVNVFFLSFLGHNEMLGKVQVIDANSLLSNFRILKRIQIGNFALINKSYFHQDDFWYNFKRLYWRSYCELAILKCVKKYKIDVIHTHFFAPDGDAGTLAKKKVKVPIVATCRGAEIFDRPDIDYGALRCKHYRNAVIRSLCEVNVVTVPNRFFKTMFLEVFPFVDSRKIAVVPNGIETIMQSRNIECLNDIATFIWIGRLTLRKNVNVVLRAVELLKDKYKFKILIIGDGVLRGQIEESVQGDLEQYIIIHHEMSKDKLYGLISRSDCLIHSSFIEGGPNVVFESLAIGVPCIVSNIPAMQKEVIDEGHNGFMFDPNNPYELAEKMRYVLENRENVFSMIERCKESARPYHINNKITEYLKIYDNLIASA